MKVKVTDHALARYEQRVSSKDNFRKNFRDIVEKWCATAVKDGEYKGKQPDGGRVYQYKGYTLIMDKARPVIITIKPQGYEPGLVNPLIEETIKKSIYNTVMRLVRPLWERKHSLVVEIHTNELKKIRVHNPQTKKIISGRIDSLHEELDEVMKDITAHSSLAYKYGINIESDM